MPKLKTVKISIDGAEKNELQFKYDIYVDQSGCFTTTIPEETAKLFVDAGFRMGLNRLKKPGFFEAASCDALITAVSKVAKDYMTKELASETIMLQYAIQTTCSYLLNEVGEVVPNGYYVKDYASNPATRWRGGNRDTNATHHYPYGLNVWVKPVRKKLYKFKSGKEKIEYERVTDDYAGDDRPNLQWLASLVGIALESGMDVEEIEYTEQAAEFFVAMIKSICMVNERIKDFTSPEAIKMLIDNKQKLLG